MVVVRTVQQRGLLDAQPNADVRTRFTPDDFGAAVGQGLQSLGSAVDKIQDDNLRIKFRQQNAVNTDKLTSLTNSSNELLDNPDTGFRTKKEKDALEGHDPVIDKWKTERDTLALSIPDKDQRERFVRSSKGMEASFLNQVNRYTNREAQSLETSTQQAFQIASRQEAVLNRDDPDAVSLSIRRQVDSLDTFGASQGLGDEEMSIRIRETIEGTLVDAIETSLDNGEVSNARGLLERKNNRKWITPRKLKQLDDRLNSGTSLEFAQELAFKAISDERAQDINTIDALQDEATTQIMGQLSGEQEKIALQQLDATFARKRRLLKGQNEAQKRNATNVVLDQSRDIVERQSFISTIEADDPALGKDLRDLFNKEEFGYPESNRVNDSLAGSLMSRIEEKKNGEFDGPDAEADVRLEASRLNLSRPQVNAAVKFLKRPDVDTATRSSLQKATQFYRQDSDAVLGVDEYNLLIDRLKEVTGGKRKATEEEINKEVAKIEFTGFIQGDGLFGSDNDGETFFNAQMKSRESDWRAPVSDVDTIRISQRIERSFKMKGLPVPPITPEAISRIRTEEIVQGGISGAAMDALTIEVDDSIPKNIDFAALDATVQAAVVEQRSTGGGAFSIKLNANQRIQKIKYDRDNETEEWTRERIGKYPSNIPPKLMGDLNTSRVWWEQVTGMQAAFKRDPNGSREQMNRINRSMPDFARALQAGIDYANESDNQRIGTATRFFSEIKK